MSYVYRTCDLPEDAGQAVAEYQDALRASLTALASDAENLVTLLDNFTDLDDWQTLLDAVLVAAKVEVSDLRALYSLPLASTAPADVEEALLVEHDLAVVDGRFVVQDHPHATPLDSYRTLFNLIGIDALEALLLGLTRFDHVVFVRHAGVVFSNMSPVQVATTLGVQVSDLAEVFVFWAVTPGISQRQSLIRQGFTSEQVFRMLRGESLGRVTVKTFPQLDLVARLRAMGYSANQMNLLFARNIRAALVTSGGRATDSVNNVAGVYQAVPYPHQLLLALIERLGSDLPQPNELTPTGARRFLSPAIMLAHVLDFATFGVVPSIQATSDEVGALNYRAQAMMATMEASAQSILDSQTLGLSIVTNLAVEAARLLEDTELFLGLDSECGFLSAGLSFPGAAISSGMGAGLYPPDFALALSALTASLPQLGMGVATQFELTVNVFSQLVEMACQAQAMMCQSRGLPSPLGLLTPSSEGGPFDADGATLSGLYEVDIFSAAASALLAQVSAQMQLIALPLQTRFSALPETIARLAACQSPANVALLGALSRT